MNARKQYAEHLRRLANTELLAYEQRALDRYEKAKAKGHCSLEAVCYFDLQQVLSEIQRRKDYLPCL